MEQAASSPSTPCFDLWTPSGSMQDARPSKERSLQQPLSVSAPFSMLKARLR